MDREPLASSRDIRNVNNLYRKAQVEYDELYIRMYIAYNAWYRQVTGTTNDRQALSLLKNRFVIWDDYCNGKSLIKLRTYLGQLSQLTKQSHLYQAGMWKGAIESADDWQGLIEYWYAVRCLLVHGSHVPRQYVWLAYETLDIFMSEIVDRMQRCFTDTDLVRMQELSLLIRSDQAKADKFRAFQRKLQAKYIDSPDVWQVDMQRAL